MQNVAQHYSKTERATANPRTLEASLLLKSATMLQSIQGDWEDRSSTLEEALLYNRKLWSVFLDSLTKPENPLPVEIKNNVASLGVFILDHTLKVQREPTPQKLSILISINQQLAAGLRGDQ